MEERKNILKVSFNQSILGTSSNFLINPIHKSNVVPASFGLSIDKFSSEASKYMEPEAILNMVKSSVEARRIAKYNNIILRKKIKPKTLNNLNTGHFKTTRDAALGIFNNLSGELKSTADVTSVILAALVHDISKVIMPDSIIYNRSPHLSKTAWEKMKLHTDLSYEMLKTTDLDPKVLRLVKYHHQNLQGTGYPAVGKDFVCDTDIQILSMADIYSALRENRSYHKPKTREEALKIIKEQYVEKGKLSSGIYDALVDYTNKEEKLAKVNPQRESIQSKFINRFRSIFFKRDQSPALDLVG